MRTIALLVVISLASIANAQCPKCGRFHAPYNAPAARANTGGVAAMWGSGRALQIAIASSQYRAARGIKGHCGIDARSGHSAGVGWSPVDSTPQTCYWGSRNRGAYASVRGRNGWYATLILY